MNLASLSPTQRLEILFKDSEITVPFDPPYPPEYGKAIWDAVLSIRPRVMVEFGVHRGFTSVIAGLAMEHVGRGRLLSYDNWEDRVAEGPDPQAIAQHNIDRYGVGHRVMLRERDFFEWIRFPDECDLIYFDIHNDGEKVMKLFEGLRDRIEQGLVVLFEGGNDERDRHPTMKGRVPINVAKKVTGYEIIVHDFPSLSRISWSALT